MKLPKLEFRNTRYPSGYYCVSCNGYNDILQPHCIYCKKYERHPDLARIAGYVELSRLGLVYEVRQYMKLSDDEARELHCRFFNHESKEVVPNMDLAQLDAHIHELEMIIFEGKARLQASVENKKSRVSKLRISERDKLITNSDISGSDALATVAKRKERMSKADKVAESLRKLGINTADVTSILSNIKIDEAKQAKVNEKIVKPEEKKEEKKDTNEKPDLSFFKFNRPQT